MNVFFLITSFLVFKFFSPSLTSQTTRLAPVLQPQLFQKQRALKKQINENIKEKNAISPQNQYAKWTKVNRAIEKLEKELGALQLDIERAAEGYKKLGKYLGFLITISFFLLRIYFRKEKLFYLPNGVFPSPLEILASFNVVKFAMNALFLKFDFQDRGFLTINNWCFLFDAFLNQVWFVFETLTKPLPVKPDEPASLKKSKVDVVQ